jgi:hypothetical protein
MGFECRIFISAEHFAMNSSPVSKDSSSGDGAAFNHLLRSLEPSPRGGGEAAGVTFGDNSVHEFDPLDALGEEQGSPLAEPGDTDLPPIEPVVIPKGTQLTSDLMFIIWIVNFAISAINGFVNQTTSLDAHQIAQALRNHARFQSKNNEHHITQFLKRTLKKFKNLANSFNAEHPANMVTLMSLGYDEQTARKILEFLNGKFLKPFGDGSKISPRDRLCWFWIFINLRMRTPMFNSPDGLTAFFHHANNPSGCPLPQDCQQVATEAHSQFESQVPKSGTSGVKGQRQARESAAASVAGSDFTTMTQKCGFLWKYHAAFAAVSKLLNEFLSGNVHLSDPRTRMSVEALIELVYRILAKMQCSKTGDFGTERAYSSYIYSKLMEAYWRARNSGTRFVLRLLETFSSILCATGNYDAAIEWLRQALLCKHPKKGDLTADEVAVLNFAFISMSLGVQSLASCTSDNLEALFVHIFDGAELEVDESEAQKFQSAIDRVAADFATPPAEVIAEVHTESDPVQVVNSVANRHDTSRRHSRGTHHSVRGGHSEHRASQDARNSELEAMMKAAAADPQKKAAMLKWLSEH